MDDSDCTALKKLFVVEMGGDCFSPCSGALLRAGQGRRPQSVGFHLNGNVVV